MSHTRNTRIIEELHEAWAMDNGYREEAASRKQEAASTKRQAPSAHTIKQQAFYKSQAK